MQWLRQFHRAEVFQGLRSPAARSTPDNPPHDFVAHTGGGEMSSVGRFPASARPLPASRLIQRTVMSTSQVIWQLSRTPVNPRAASTCFSASVILSGSPATNSTRQVVHRAFPPQACNWSMWASSTSARTSRLPAATSNCPTSSTVNFGTIILPWMKSTRLTISEAKASAAPVNSHQYPDNS
jgi:hypothetical protein